MITDYDLYQDSRNTFELESVAKFRNIQIKADEQVAKESDKVAFLTQINQQLADEAYQRTVDLFGNMIDLGSPKMKLHFDLMG